jgi:hypothetical protein
VSFAYLIRRDHWLIRSHFELGELKSITSSYPQSPTSTYDVAAWMQRRASEGSRPSLLLPMFEAALHQLPKAVGHLHASTSTDPDFQHLRYIELLLRLAAFLDEEDAHVVVDFYKEECLCLPFTEGWIDNIWKLLNGFYLSTSNFDSVRKKVAKLLFEDVYGNAEDFTDLRTELVSQYCRSLARCCLIKSRRNFSMRHWPYWSKRLWWKLSRGMKKDDRSAPGRPSESWKRRMRRRAPVMS